MDPIQHDGTDITQIELGTTYRDTITGFEGQVIGRAQYLTGCAQALLTANVRGRVESIWFDYPRLEEIDAEPLALAGESSVRRSGGPTPAGALSTPPPA